MIKLADIVAGKVIIHPDLLLIPEFNKLWETDPKHATKVISYIVFNNEWDSPYVTSGDQLTREPRLKEKIFGDKKYQLTEEEAIAEKEYKAFKHTSILEMLTNMRLKLDSISSYYKSSLDEALDEKKIKDLLTGMTSVGSVIKSINSLETMVKAGEMVTGKVKGDSKVNPYEMP